MFQWCRGVATTAPTVLLPSFTSREKKPVYAKQDQTQEQQRQINTGESFNTTQMSDLQYKYIAGLFNGGFFKTNTFKPLPKYVAWLRWAWTADALCD